MLEFQNISIYRREKRILDDFNLKIPDGAIMGLLGSDSKAKSILFSLPVTETAGLRISGEGIEIAPALPEQWNGYHFRFRYHDSSVRICVDKEKIAVELTQGGPVSMKVYGRSMQLLPGQPISEKLRR